MKILKLLGERRFAAFFWAQALGAFNDNLIKNLLVLLVTYDNVRFGSPNAASTSSIASAIFTLPFIVFAGLSGQLADRFSKRSILRIVKVFEILIMGVAVFGLIYSSLNILLIVLFAMGVHSTFFSPAKYSILPELLTLDELPLGNGLLEAGTFLAILLGMLAAIGLYSLHDNTWLEVGLMATAVLGLIFSLWIPDTPLRQADLKIDFNPWTSIRDNFEFARHTPAIWSSIFGISWFWGIGIVVLAQIPVLVHDDLHANEVVVSLLLGGFTSGIGVGSLLGAMWRAERLNERMSGRGLIGLSTALLCFVVLITLKEILPHAVIWLVLSVISIGLAGGLFVVPLYTCLNTESQAPLRSRIISANSVMNFAFMIVFSLIASIILQRGISVGQLFLVLATGNIVFSLWYRGYQQRCWAQQRQFLGLSY